ncbi:hypothetical protein HKK55_10640 [Pseudomonas sp. ADAK18]|uniref:hypothetical protein n=1 Tax=Pseudomonas sp. ADAK18 TaxID=2730848 RepID=UPI001462C22F|nr:hypothetical protein [Pseudomonas sp. ADAK18]QJI29149.1 hypothetical protein HKK55_10640 [Pseudomonas sp. ADAK18]
MPMQIINTRHTLPSAAAHPLPSIPLPQLMPRIRRSAHNETHDRAAADAILAERLTTALTSGYSMVQVPAGSTLSPLLTIYQQMLSQPELQNWIKSKGLETAKINMHKDFIEGYADNYGMRTAVKFTAADDSGWWQASVKLRGIRALLDPTDQGLNYVGDDDHWVPRNVVMHAFNLQAPDSQEDVDLLISRLRTDGLSLPADDRVRRDAALDCARQTINDLQERQNLAERLSLLVADLPDGSPVDWSSQASELSPGSPLAKDDHEARERLRRFIELPQMRELLRDEGAGWPGLPFRISEGKFEQLTPVGGWRDFTRYVEGLDALSGEFAALQELSEPLGNALYSTRRYDMRQLIDFKGLGSPRTAGETRSVIEWLRTSLPPAPPLGDYAGLMGREWAPGQLSENDKSTLGTLARTRLSGTQSRGFIELAGKAPQVLRTHTAKHLDNLLNSPDALAFGEQLGRAVNWYGAARGGPGLSKEVRQQLVIAAIKLHVDPDMPGKPGEVGGYPIYQPANMGRSLNDVRDDIEKHLREKKGLDPKLAILATHLCLAQAAPEFLVRDVPDAVHIGTPAWMELRLGCAMADSHAPGTSRVMNEEQVTGLTTLAPVSQAHQTLMQLHGLRIMADWGVLNGVVRQRRNGAYSQADIQDATKAFFKQRGDASAAFTAAASALPTRRTLAIKELLRVFPDLTAAQLETTTVQIADDQARRNMSVSEPRTRSIIETYMTGDLTPGKWALTQDMVAPTGRSKPATPYQSYRGPQAAADKRADLDRRLRRLPELGGLLEKKVDDHYKSLQGAYATKLKLMIAELPLMDRRALELGKVELFTLRGETDETLGNEIQAQREASRGRQGTLMRVEHDNQVRYYEIFAKGKIIRRTDLPEVLTLNGVVQREKLVVPNGSTNLYVRRGHVVGFDFDAYTKGSEPRPKARSSKIIIEKLGSTFEARVLPGNQGLNSFAPDTYTSKKTASIVSSLVAGNFPEAQNTMLERAREQLPLEERREAIARDHSLLVGLVPFVGAYQEFADGNIGRGMFYLTLDLAGVAIGAAGRARALIRSAKALGPAPVAGLIGKLRPSVSPLAPKAAWAKPGISFSDRAFDFAKETVLFGSAAMNPLDGYSQMVNAAVKGLDKLPRLIAGGSVRLGKVGPHLLSAEEKLRCYLMVAAGLSDGDTKLVDRPVVGTPGQLDRAQPRQYNGHWYSVDPRSGEPFGPPLRDYSPPRVSA